VSVTTSMCKPSKSPQKSHDSSATKGYSADCCNSYQCVSVWNIAVRPSSPPAAAFAASFSTSADGIGVASGVEAARGCQYTGGSTSVQSKPPSRHRIIAITSDLTPPWRGKVTGSIAPLSMPYYGASTCPIRAYGMRSVISSDHSAVAVRADAGGMSGGVMQSSGPPACLTIRQGPFAPGTRPHGENSGGGNRWEQSYSE
jgi:hypothetical protein